MSADEALRFPQLRDPGWLKVRHQVEGMYPSELAGMIGCSEGGARNALIRYGLYRPLRRSPQMRVLAHIDDERLLRDAKTVSSWWSLAKLYSVQICVVQDHALYLGVFDQVPQLFDPQARGNVRRGPEPNRFLQSRDWIAGIFGEEHSIQAVARAAGTHARTVYRWLEHHGMSADEMRDARNRAIVVEYEQGYSLHELARRFSLDPAGVFRVLARAGVPTGRRRH